MDAITLKALRGSIKKWRNILAEKDTDRGSDNCALCHTFCLARSCEGCPVEASTGHHFCDGSPYRDWDDLPGTAYAVGDVGQRHVLPSTVTAAQPGNHLCIERSYSSGELVVGHLTVAGYQAANAELEFLISLLPEGESEEESHA